MTVVVALVISALSTQHTALRVWAVIPTLSALGPLAILAAVFPAVFGALMLWLKRWSNYLGALSAASTLDWLHRYFGWFAGSWWGTDAGLWAVLAGSIVPFALAAAWRYHRNVDAMQPTRADRATLGLTAIALAALLAWRGYAGSDLLRWPWLEVCVAAASAAGAGLYLLASRRTAPAALSGESVALWTLLTACIAALALNVDRAANGPARPGYESPNIVWSVQLAEPARLHGGITCDGDRVYLGANHAKGFGGYGAVYSLDLNIGQQVWQFDNGGDMKPVFCTPAVASGRVFIGEGYHEDKDCRLFCLDAATGAKVWSFATASHTESGPVVADGRVYFGAGDDGLYCLDVATGQRVWHYEGFHVDASPVVTGGRAFASSGSGDGNRYNATELFCLDAATGKPVWRVPVDLSAFGACAVVGGKAYFGLGNGDFVKSHPRPAGALVCVDANTGQRLWRCDVPDAVLTRPAVGDGLVYFGSRDGHVYAADAVDGRVRWKASLGGPVVASPALVEGRLYAAGGDGRLARLDPTNGREVWAFDTPRAAGTSTVELWATPAATAKNGRNSIVLAATASNGIASTGRLWRLDDAE